MVVRGVPTRLAKDAWWLDDEVPPLRWLPGVLLLVTVLLADLMLWATRPGVGFGVWVVAIAVAVHVTLWRRVDHRLAARAWGLLVLALMPIVEVVRFSSVVIALLGLMAFSVVMLLGCWDARTVLQAMRRLPYFGVAQVVVDLFAMRVSVPSRGTFGRALFDWALPAGLGTVFVVLMAAANPLVDQWLLKLAQFESGLSLDGARTVFWVFIAFVIWPFMRLTQMATALAHVPEPRQVQFRSGLLNDRSVVRALLVFNLIFAVQSLLDAGYLWGGVALPEAMTYAEYAHRGAYPLLVTALLAGLFALMSQPFLEGRPVLRVLLYVWVAQTVLLVVSSILRLDLYMEVYGMTRLRFAALIWMVLVALGLLLMIMQMVGRQTVGWFMLRAAALGLVAVYACAFVNVDGLVARTNLAREKPDLWYLCDLSEGAAPAILKSGLECPSRQPFVSTPSDWREWGYRNARLRRSLAKMEVQQ